MASSAAASRARAEHLGPQRRRPQVLDAALAIAAADGVAAVTMAAIAERMGVTRPVVYACYGGRGEVLAALLDRETEVMLQRLFTMLPPQRTGSIEQLFVDGFRTLLQKVAERPESWRIMFVADPDPALAEAVRRGRAQIANRFAVALRPLLERRGVTDIDRTLPPLVEVFLAICESAVRMMLDGDWTPDALAAVVGPAAYRALRATG